MSSSAQILWHLIPLEYFAMSAPRIFITMMAALMLAALVVQPASAVKAHFLFTTGTVNADGSITVTFKEAGLGNSLNSVLISISGTADCINGGGSHPKAANKSALAASGTFTVSNGQASGSLTTNAPAFTPSCTPPMTVQVVNAIIIDPTFHDSAPVTF
jgi:hypothetical protein